VVVRLTGGVLLTLGNAMALLIGYVLFEDGVFTIGTVYLVVHYAGLFGRPIHVLTQHAESLQNVGAATERLVDLRRVEHRVLDGPGATFPPGPLSLAFESVSFAYAREDREPEDEEEPLPAEDGRVLKDVSFRLEPGRVLGLLGRTGSGKTTLARLLFRFYDPGVGRIVLGGVDVRQPTLRDLRQRVAIVTQDVQLFQASVRDNLTFFDRAVPDERLLAVIEEMELAGWYRSLPEGLDSGIETGGRSLSAGEGQLLAFARVFLRDPGLVILDEASSRLDPATEQRIERAVDRLLTDRTAIVIAHRLATVQRADEILILEAGGVAESGARGRLAGDPTSRFYGLLRAGLEEVLV
jgi:ATP-binding cassette subfamily B protein